MAKKEKKNAGAKEGKEGKEGKEPKEKPLFPILIIMLVLILFLAAGFVYLILNKDSSKSSTSSASTNTVVESSVVTVPTYSYTFEKDFLVNLADTDKSKYLKANITLGYDNKKLTAELTSNSAVVRDAINSVLRNKNSTDLTSKGTEDLKKELISRINPLLKKGKISDVYFNDFIVQ